jgi:lambda repressor-like predicted transcriptional regulator
MHPELIKAEMRMRGVTPAALADELGISRMGVGNVVNGHQKSRRVMEAVAKLIGKPVNEIWPDAKPSALRRSKKAVATWG